ncbi:hypothetical protein [Armatimonas sp.]|uniref:hypothetical protein n=1 Tax=Armatimonas sp. TaxID=1872638 RepID=UPI00375031EC
MQRRLWKKIGWSIGALALFTLVGLAMVRLIPPPFPMAAGVTQRLPELDNRLMCGWLGNDQVVTGVRDRYSLFYYEMQEPQEIFELRGRTRRLTPILPKLPEEEEGSYSSRRSSPAPSPDGKWLLYDEWGYHNHQSLFKRWRLVRSDGTASQLIPFPAAAEVLFPHWLADSGGWIGTGSSTGTTSKPIAYLNRINGTHITQTPLALSETVWGLKIVAGGELLFAPNWRIQPQQIVYKSSFLNTPALVQKHSLRLPSGKPDLSEYGHSPFDFSHDGRFLIVRAYMPRSDNSFLAWFQGAIPSRDSGYIFWRIPRNGDSPERLPLPGDVVDFSLSPDGAKILYWRNIPASGAQAYLLTLPERNR